MVAIPAIRVVGGSEAVASAEKRPRYLFGPLWDFLLLGGLSLLLLPVALLLPAGAKPTVGIVMFIVALAVNHPHFAHSYQLFYRDFRAKAFSELNSRSLRTRYLVAGIVVPVALTAFFVFAVASADLRILGLAANVMAFFVGWHYVKQGYGMLMVDGALKRRFFGAADKKVLVVNSYAVWALTWVLANSSAAQSKLFHIESAAINVPPQVERLAIAVAACTTVAAVYVLWRKASKGGGLPVNGVVAYGVSLYLWMAFVRIDPIWVLIVPALHSLQYLTVVWRYELNRSRAVTAVQSGAVGPARPLARLRPFIVAGVLLGLLGFWGLPGAIDIAVANAAFGAPVFLFSFWVFINVHHYFIDNVIWRSENADVKKYLFS